MRSSHNKNKPRFGKSVIMGVASALILSAALASGYAAGAFLNRPKQQISNDPAPTPAEQAFAMPKETMAATEIPSPTPVVEAESSEEEYVVGESGGFIAVFIAEGDELTLKELTDRSIDLYDDDEQQRLRDGIHAASRTDLIRILQDYDS